METLKKGGRFFVITKQRVCFPILNDEKNLNDAFLIAALARLMEKLLRDFNCIKFPVKIFTLSSISATQSSYALFYVLDDTFLFFAKVKSLKLFCIFIDIIKHISKECETAWVGGRGVYDKTEGLY